MNRLLPAFVAALFLLLLPPAAYPQQADNPAIAAAPRTDAGWVARHESFNARAKQGHAKGDIGIFFLGDSITQGWEGAGREVWEKSFAPRNAVNFGISGDRTQHLLWRIQNGNLDGLAKPETGGPPRLAVIMIGTNNIGGETPEQIAAGIGAVVAGVREKLPETQVLLLGVFPRGEKADDEARVKVEAVNRLLAKDAPREGVAYLDIGARFLEASAKPASGTSGSNAAPPPKPGQLSKEVAPDFLHFSPLGYQVWADAMEERVRGLLGKGRRARQPRRVEAGEVTPRVPRTLL